MKNSKLKVSVLMVVFNSEKYLAEAIESILNQTFADFEFIIVDDGSTDNTLQIIQSYTDSRIKYYKNEKNFGIPYSRNRCLELAKGEYLAWLDSDDISLPTRLKIQVEYMDRNRNIGVVGSWIKTLGASNVTLKSPIQKELICVSLLFNSCIYNSSSMIRGSTIRQGGYRYDEHFVYAQDYDLWSRLANDGIEMANIPMALVKYRVHANSVGRLNPGEQQHLASEVRRRQLVRLGLDVSNEQLQLHTKIAHNTLLTKSSESFYALSWLLQILGANFVNPKYDNGTLIMYISRYFWRILLRNKTTRKLFHPINLFMPFISWIKNMLFPKPVKGMIDNNILISIIIPTYNREKLLKESIASVISQTYQHFELIIVDDGSTDNTKEVVHSFHDNRIKYIKLSNSGFPSKVKNYGLKHASGSWVAFLDSDDIWLPKKLQKQVEIIHLYDVFLVATNARILCCDDLSKAPMVKNLKSGILTEESFFPGNTIVQSSVLVRKSVLDGFNGFSPTLKISEDFDLWIKIFLKYNCYYLNDDLVIYRVHNDSLTANSVTVLEAEIEFFNQYYAKYDIPLIYIRKKYSSLLFRMALQLFSNDESGHVKLAFEALTNDWSARNIVKCLVHLFPYSLYLKLRLSKGRINLIN